MNILSEINFLIYIIVGTLFGIVLYYIMGREFFGRIYGAVIVSIIGAIIGGGILQPIIIKLSQFFYETFKINLFSTFIGIILLLWLFKLLSREIRKR